MNYYPFHIGDYASHTQRLSLMEDLAYRRMMDAYYVAERPFNGCSTDVAREIGMMDQLESVEYVLQKFFTKSETGFFNKRCDQEIAHFHDKKEKSSKAGKASAERRLNIRSTSVGKDSTSVGKKLTDVQPTNNQEPITNIDVASSATQPTKKATRITSGWSPNPELEKWSKSERPDLNIESTTESFVDYWIAKPGKDGLKLDWDATFRNWVKAQRQSFNPGKQASNVFAGAI